MGLSLRLRLDASDGWFEAVLGAASATEPDNNVATPDWRAATAREIEACIARFAERDGKDLAKTLARLVQVRPTEPWSDATIDRICDLAVSHTDPAPGEFSWHSGDGDVSGHDLVQNSINCTRGVAVGAIERLMWYRPDKLEQFVRVAYRAAGDAHPAVRTASIGLAGPLLKDDPDRAIDFLNMACAGDDVRVLGAFHFNGLLNYLWWRDDERVAKIIARMAISGIKEIEEIGALYATVMSVRQGREKALADDCATGNTQQRKGVATALARMTDSTPEGRSAAGQLSKFFNDADPTVAGAAASVFRDNDVMHSLLGPQLAAQFVNSRQFERNPDDLMFALSEFAGDLLPFQPVLADVVKRATTDMSGLNGNLQRSGYRFADSASECVVRIYERAQGREHSAIRSWCLNQIDDLVAGGDYFGEQALARLDADS